VLCGSVDKNADSLVKGMTLCAQVGRGRGGGKRSWSKSLPPVSDIFAVSKILVGNSPAGPPISVPYPYIDPCQVSDAEKWQEKKQGQQKRTDQ
jgi:hypothetical protein